MIAFVYERSVKSMKKRVKTTQTGEAERSNKTYRRNSSNIWLEHSVNYFPL